MNGWLAAVLNLLGMGAGAAATVPVTEPAPAKCREVVLIFAAREVTVVGQVLEVTVT